MTKKCSGTAPSGAAPACEVWKDIPGYEGLYQVSSRGRVRYPAYSGKEAVCLGGIETLSIDIETFSSENLSKSGAYRYAEAPDFRVLLFGCSVNGGPVRVYDLASGEELPKEILAALTDESVLKCAFNASFERVCLSRYLQDLGLLAQGEFLSPAGWRCTMIRCAYLGLPLSLANAGAVLGLDKQKLTAGKELIRFFCLPAKPSLLNGQSNRNGPSADPNRWQQFVEYNRRDVEVEMQIQERLKNYPVPESVWKEYELDQEINDRGILVDDRLVSAAFAMDEISRNELTSELSRLTLLSNPNSVSQIRSWLIDHGSEMESLGKKEVAAMLRDADPEIREVLILRQQLAKSSVKKYEAMRNTACADGRVRGMFQFYGASRSGRWAGRGVQLQNLPQNHLPDLDQGKGYGPVRGLRRGEIALRFRSGCAVGADPYGLCAGGREEVHCGGFQRH